VRILLDQGVPRRAAALLRKAGVDALHVADLEMSSADDADILWCRDHGAIAVTLDADFHASIALSGESAPSGSSLIFCRPARPSSPQGLWSLCRTAVSGCGLFPSRENRSEPMEDAEVRART